MLKPAPYCDPSASDAAIIAVFRERCRVAPLGRWATTWGGTMDPFEGLWFRNDGTGVHATQPGLDYSEQRFTWQALGERSVQLNFVWEADDEPDEEDPRLLEYDFQVRRTDRQIDVELVNTLPVRTVLPWAFRFWDAPLLYVAGPDESDEPVRWSLWGGIKYFG